MAQVWKEVADLGFVIAFRFYGRYPETGRSFYHPPLCESNNNLNEAGEGAAASSSSSSDNGRSSRRSPARRRAGLQLASSLILPTLQSAPSLSEFFAAAAFRDLDGVLPSPAAVSVGAH